jgi:UDP-N-acetyl-D-galactosamine dehydrogenase
MEERIAVIGLGYVGLPIALAFARRFPNTIGFDLNQERVSSLKRGEDATREVDTKSLSATTLEVSSDPRTLEGASFFVVAVPTQAKRWGPRCGPEVSSSSNRRCIRA